MTILNASWLAWASSGVSKGLPAWLGDPGVILWAAGGLLLVGGPHILSASWFARACSGVSTGLPVWPGDPVDDPVVALCAAGGLLLGGPIGSPAVELPF